MDVDFDIDPEEFQQRKRRRMSAMNNAVPTPPKVAPTSAPGVHEVATFLPGRLEFEHELDNEAEELVKDLEFGICLTYGGDQIMEDENDADVKARAQMLEERKSTDDNRFMSQPPTNGANGYVNGHGSINGDTSRPHSVVKSEEPSGSDQQTTGEDDPNAEEPMQPPPFETEDSLAFKLMMIEMYNQRVAKRHEAKAVIFNRGLLEYKKVGLVPFIDFSNDNQSKMQAAEKKRAKDEKDIVQRLRPFARLQTAEDYEVFSADILCKISLSSNGSER